MDATIFPLVRQDLRLYDGTRDLDGSPTWTLHDPLRNQFFTLGWLEFEILKRWPLADADHIVNQINHETTLIAHIQHIELFTRFLDMNQLLDVHGNEVVRTFTQKQIKKKGEWAKKIIHNYLFIRRPLFHPDHFLDWALPYIRPFLTRALFSLIVVLGLSGLYLAGRQWDNFTQTFSYFFNLQGLVYYGAALFFIKIMHEFGHAFACKLYGLRVPSMGVALLVMWPVLYTDTTEAWKLTSRRQRLVIGSAGVLVELSLAFLAIFLWSFLPDGPLRSAMFFIATISWVLTLTINVNPFLRWDGYYLLSDFLGVHNLQSRSFALAKWRLREWLFGMGKPQPESLTPRMRNTLLLYAYATWIYRFILFLGIALLIYYFMFKLAGIILMLIEVYWFIVKPIFKEVSVWLQYRQEWAAGRGRHLLLVLLPLLLLMVIPIDRHVEGPGIIHSEKQQEIHVSEPAKLSAVYVKNNEYVRKGDALMEFSSPDTSFKLELSRLNLVTLQQQLARIANDYRLYEQRSVLIQKIAEAEASFVFYEEKLGKLIIKAEYDGEVRDLDDQLHVGQWVDINRRLAVLVDTSQPRLTAYVPEASAKRLHAGDNAMFYPNDITRPPQRFRLQAIDYTGVKQIEEAYLTSTHTGDIAVNVDQKNRAVPLEAVYRVRLVPIKNNRLADTIVPGQILISADPVSMLSIIWRNVVAVLVRESSF